MKFFIIILLGVGFGGKIYVFDYVDVFKEMSCIRRCFLNEDGCIYEKCWCLLVNGNGKFLKFILLEIDCFFFNWYRKIVILLIWE